METVRGILEAHRLGISKPGLLAWARLRIDTAMTDAQLDEELARLGDEVVDVDGFLYLRAYVDPSRRPARTGTTPPAPTLASVQAVSAPPADRAWSPPAPSRVGRGGIGKVIGIGVFLWWLIGFVGGLIGGGAKTEPSFPDGTTQLAGPEVAWTDLAVGECFTYSEDGGGTLRRLACDELHGYELYEIAKHPGTAFPGEAAFATFANDVCPRAFAAYTGAWPEDQQALTWSWWSPSEAEWNSGIADVACMLSLEDGSLADHSYRSTSP